MALPVRARPGSALRRGLRRLWSALLVLFFCGIAHATAVAQPSGEASRPPAANAAPARLTVGVLASNWRPFEALEGGRLTGMSVDYLRALVGPDVVIEAKAFPDMPQLLAAACAGQVDLLMSLARTPERERCLRFTVPYFRSSISAVARRDGEGYGTASQLGAARIAIEKGFALERSVRERFPRAEINAFATTHAALAAVVRGDADAYFGFTPAVQYALATDEFRSLSVAFEEGSKTADLRFGVPRSRTALRDQLDRALASLDPADDAALRVRWLPGNFDAGPVTGAPRLVLTSREQAWLRSLPPLPVGFDSTWPPFSYVDDARPPARGAAHQKAYFCRTLGG
ncbi:transporter substrate-binding domain-containing protein, partial [Paraburkholderia dilworthii]|uniref:transporter substrate-binding domain-containing protein n=1 Tax=Paraburkholderia dilworthii TaxID=948106 RepID=UPI0038BA135E